MHGSAVQEWIAQALERLAEGDAAQALVLLDRALVQDPAARSGRSSARLLRALVLLDREDFAGAETDARAHLALQPDDAAGWLCLGRAKAGLGQPAPALECIDRALAARPDWSDALWHRASSRAVLRDLAGAVQDLDQALRLLPAHSLGSGREARIFEARAQLRLLAEDREGARLDFIRAAAVWDARGEPQHRERIVAEAKALGL